MTIVYYSDAPCLGGAEVYLEVLARRLPRDRFAPHMVLRPLPALQRLRAALRQADVPIHTAPEPSPPSPAHWTSVYRTLRKHRADVFHVNLPGPYDGRLGTMPAVGRAAGVPVVTTEHLPMFRGSWKRRLAKRLSGACVTRVVTVSDHNAACLERLHGVRPGKIRRIYNGVDLSAFVPGEGRDEMRAELGLDPGHAAVGIVGRLDRQKGHEYFLDGADRVHAARPEARFVIVGEGDLRPALEADAARRGLEDVVRFTGYRADVPRVLAALDLVVFASLHEGMPFALLEAMAMERPVVATDVYGLSEIVRDGETGRVVRPRDGAALAVAMDALIGSPERARAMGRAGRARVEASFQVEDMVRRTADVYEEVAGGREGGVR